jgi:hypothetical protein
VARDITSLFRRETVVVDEPQNVKSLGAGLISAAGDRMLTKKSPRIRGEKLVVVFATLSLESGPVDGARISFLCGGAMTAVLQRAV